MRCESGAVDHQHRRNVFDGHLRRGLSDVEDDIDDRLLLHLGGQGGLELLHARGFRGQAVGARHNAGKEIGSRHIGGGP
jgi:hypothetical protein